MKCVICSKKVEITVVKNYHYTMSGLDNIYLSDIPVSKCACGETPKVEGLHSLIVKKILQKNDLLTGREIRFMRQQMKLEAAELAEQVGVGEDVLLKWEDGAESAGLVYDKLLRMEFMLNYVKQSDAVSKEPTRKFAEFIAEIITKQGIQVKEEKISISEKEICNERLIVSSASLTKL
ncbi:MAG: YgiT-type zinc finger protein [wastewater metagenome]|nr:YgiT-type zinc finger protein [Candidatus Loosdrechtia aerotolerans]